MDRSSRPRFSLDEFKKWLSSQEELKEFFDIGRQEKVDDGMVGCEVYSRISRKKLAGRMRAHRGDLDDMIEEFSEDGGFVTGTDKEDLLIEVASGTFHIQKFCVRSNP